MQELSQILKYEQKKKEEIEKAEKEAQAEIEKKRQTLAHKLEGESFLNEQEKNKFFEYQKRKLAEIEQAAFQKLEKELKELERKQQENSKKAVEYVVDELINYR